MDTIKSNRFIRTSQLLTSNEHAVYLSGLMTRKEQIFFPERPMIPSSLAVDELPNFHLLFQLNHLHHDNPLHRQTDRQTKRQTTTAILRSFLYHVPPALLPVYFSFRIDLLLASDRLGTGDCKRYRNQMGNSISFKAHQLVCILSKYLHY